MNMMLLSIRIWQDPMIFQTKPNGILGHTMKGWIRWIVGSHLASLRNTNVIEKSGHISQSFEDSIGNSHSFAWSMALLCMAEKPC